MPGARTIKFLSKLRYFWVPSSMIKHATRPSGATHPPYLAVFIILIYHVYMQISFFAAHENIYIHLRVKLATRKSLNTGCGYMPLSRHVSTCVQMARHDNMTDYSNDWPAYLCLWSFMLRCLWLSTLYTFVWYILLLISYYSYDFSSVLHPTGKGSFHQVLRGKLTAILQFQCNQDRSAQLAT